MARAETGGEATAQEAAPRARPGWLRWLLLALWLPLALAAGAGPIAGSAIVGLQGPVGAVLKLGLRPAPSGLAPFAAEAIASGFPAGGVIIASDPPPSLGRAEGQVVRVTARAPDGTIGIYRLTSREAHVRAFFAGSGLSLKQAALFNFLLDLVPALALTAAAALLFLRGKLQPVPLLLSFGFLGLSLYYFAGPMSIVPGVLRVPVLVSSYSMLILAVMLFPSGRFSPPWMKWAALLTVALTPFGGLGLIEGAAWPLLHAMFLLAAVASLVRRYRRLPIGPERQQIRWAMLGFSVAMAFLALRLVLDNSVLERALSPAGWIWAQLASSLLISLMAVALAGGMIVSLLRFRLYDADTVIARSVSYGILTLSLLALFTGSERVIELLGHEYLGEELGVLAGGIGAAFAAAMIVPLHHRLSRWAERRFQKDLLRLRHVLPALLGDLRETAPLSRIAAATLDSVTQGVRASRAALLVDGAVVSARGIAVDEAEAWRLGWLPPAKDGLDADRADRLFPLRVPLDADGHGRVGWLLLGPRPDGSFYGKDERRALEDIADPVARALEIAQSREAREAAERERWRGQDSLNAEIKAVNAELVRILGSLDEKLGHLVPSPRTAAAD